MATTVRRISRLATTIRTSSSAAIRQPIPFHTITKTNAAPHNTHWFSSISGGQSFLTGRNVALYSTATSEAREVHERGYVPKDLVLYQYQACPFCNKVKAYLEYNDLPYKIVEVNPINKKEIKWSDYKKVPILKVDGEPMVDSTDIIDKLHQRMHPDSGPEDEETKKWRGWVDNHLVHVLSPNIYRSPSEAIESFDYITTQGNFSFAERLVAKYSGAAAMYFVSKKLKKRHNITDERKALYEAAETWVDALKGRQYLSTYNSIDGICVPYKTLGGSEPNLGDLAVFGVLRPIRYLTAGKDMVENTRIGEWFTRMESQMKPQC